VPRRFDRTGKREKKGAVLVDGIFAGKILTLQDGRQGALVRGAEPVPRPVLQEDRHLQPIPDGDR